MFVSWLMLLLSLAVILLAAGCFTNGIEVFGHRLKVHQGAVGSVFAAVGTAMPETIIPIIAIARFHFNGAVGGLGLKEAEGTAIGAIAGAPFMLATLALFVTGLAVILLGLLGRRSTKMIIDAPTLSRDLTYFIVVYTLAIATSFLAPDALGVSVSSTIIRLAVAAILLGSYIFYVKRTFAADVPHGEDIEVLYLLRGLRLFGGHKTRSVHMILIIAQLLLGMALMLYGADMFVRYVGLVSQQLGVPALMLSLLITPIATELPEKCNSVIWISKKKDILALGNMTGAMVFQSSFPAMFGILFTSWELRQDGGITLASAALALISATLMLAWVKRTKSMSPYVLMVGGLLYVAFIAYVVRSRV